jgi:hypothetical protein
METLFAIGMMVGLMKSQAQPPKVAPTVEQHHAEIDKTKPRKKSEWPLGY